MTIGWIMLHHPPHRLITLKRDRFTCKIDLLPFLTTKILILRIILSSLGTPTIMVVSLEMSIETHPKITRMPTRLVFSPGQPQSQKGLWRKRGTRGGRRIRSKEKKTVDISGVFNLSKVLSEGEQRVLSLGLKFAPPHRLNKFETFIDIHKFIKED